ncbi:S1 family peptidase [Austwickia chelonae]|uniref:S1 family peptidase n=1 Tax=Austwickia chelonae TaxID=100225 RepID=UPI000E261B4F|nr:S1 family peptidase [Austwickia chelonae]
MSSPIRTAPRRQNGRGRRAAGVLAVVLAWCVLPVPSVSAALDRGGDGVRVVGGEEVKRVEENPGVVSLGLRGDPQCTGSRIAPRWVLTARHCAEPTGEGEAIGVDTAYTRTVTFGVGPRAKIVEAVFAPVGDMAVVKLDSEPEGSFLPWTDRRPRRGDLFTVIGWGSQSFETDPSRQLRRGTQRMDRFEGTSNYPDLKAAVLTPVTGTGCSGDSGGPLLRDGKVWGAFLGGDCRSEGFYTTTADNASWISRTTGVAPTR